MSVASGLVSDITFFAEKSVLPSLSDTPPNLRFSRSPADSALIMRTPDMFSCIARTISSLQACFFA